jgi:hypothetical protein
MVLRGNRRWPPGVTKAATSPWSAHRRRVPGVMPRIRLASPRLSHGDRRRGLTAPTLVRIMAKTIDNYRGRRLDISDDLRRGRLDRRFLGQAGAARAASPG